MEHPDHDAMSPAGGEALPRFQAAASYRPLRGLGGGGMGEVWLAERLTLGGHRQRVAVKFPYHDELWGDVSDEALRVSRLAHAHAARDENGEPWSGAC